MINMRELMLDALKHRPQATLDAADDATPLEGMADYTEKDIAMKAAAAIQQWAETDDLDTGETYADRLWAHMVGIADANKDGEITDDEQGVLDVALNSAWDYLSGLGVSDDDCSLLLNDWDTDASDRVRELVASALPDGDDAARAEIDKFAFSSEDQEPALDAVYRKTLVVRGGKKVRINKRISGHVKLSAKQKVAIRRAQMKSHSAGAMMHRMKSIKLRTKMGLR